MKLIAFTIFLFLILFSPLGHTQDWKWVGFEVIGNRKIERDAIISHIPLKIGEIYQEDFPSWQAWCDEIVSSMIQVP